MNLYKIRLAVGMVLLCATNLASASITWTFNLPSTGTPSNNPVYPTVATLTLTQIGNDVQFILDPNESSPGVNPASGSFVKSIDFVYQGHALTSNDFQYDSGAMVQSFNYKNDVTMDSGYKADSKHIVVDFFDNNQNSSHFADNFDFTETSTWTILGTTLGDFTDTKATANNKPTPISGVISVAPYALASIHPTPSNWVAGYDGSGPPSSIPVPAAVWLFGSGLVGVMSLTRRKG